MNDRWKVLLLASLVFNAAVAGALVFGFFSHARFDRERDRFGDRAGRVPRGRYLMREMGLSAEKRERVGRVLDETDEEAAAVHGRLEAAREELHALLRAERPDEAALFAKIDEIASIQGELEKLVVRRLLRVGDILDAGERERFLRLLQRRMRSDFRRQGREAEHRR